MSSAKVIPTSLPQQQETARKWSPAELRKMDPAARDAILSAAAEAAEEEYRTDPELTAFEAFGKDDLFTSSANDITEPR